MVFSITRYISGQFALDLHRHSHLLGWSKGFRPIPPHALFGSHEPEKNTLDCLGAWGLHEASAWLKHFGYELPKEDYCFVAEPMRAVTDLIFFLDATGAPSPFLSEMHVQSLWQKLEILSAVEKLARHHNRLQLLGWIEFERDNTL